ncbi:MAG: adenosylcobinamide-GDP ribazoletransferase [Synergistaceae bacterium]|nr:adenosylcobinamide-GDP ribazoletransferase [Synergistaceae bacterium]
MRKIFEEYMRRLENEFRDSRFSFNFFARFVVIWTLLTRIPLPKRFWPDEMITGKDALALSPLVGGILGMLTGVLIAVVTILGMGNLSAAWIGVAFYAFIGWAIHLDGWSDLWDGLGSGKSGEELRSVMKDSCVGSYGVTGLILALGLWTSLLSSVPTTQKIVALMIAGSTGRFAICIAALTGKYPWEQGLAKGWVDGFEGYDIFIAGICTLFFMPFAPISWAFSMVFASLAAYFMSSRMNEKLGGVNGDVLGAAAVAGELISLAIFAL